MATKKVKDLKKGDMIKTEFGTEGNWIEVEVQKVKRLEEGSLNCKMYCKFKSGNKVEMFANAEEIVEIVEGEKNNGK